MALPEPILEIDTADSVRNYRLALQHNAQLLIIDSKLGDDGVLTLYTQGGDTLATDFTAVYLTKEEYKLLSGKGGGPADETSSGPVALVRVEDIKDIDNPDDTRAMTMAKTLILLDGYGLPKFDTATAIKGDLMTYDGERWVPTKLSKELIALLDKPSDELQKVLCAAVAKCTTGGNTGGNGGNNGGGTNPTTPVSSFETVHYVFVDIIDNEPKYDYVLGDGKYAGTLDGVDGDYIAGWALERAIGSKPTDHYFRTKGGIEPLTALTLNFIPNNDRGDVTTAPGINTPSAVRCGFKIPTPDVLRQGKDLEVRTFIAGTQIELKDSPRYINLAAKVQPKTDYYRIIGNNAPEGGPGQQQVLEQQYTDGSWKAVAVETWGLKTGLSGITIAGGVLKADANTVNGTTQVGVTAKPVGSATIVEDVRQIIEAGCFRESNLKTYTLTWNIAPVNGDAVRFASLDDANNRMGQYFVDTTKYNVGQFKVQVVDLAVGAKVYYRDDQNNCEVASDGTYYVTTSANANTVKLSIRVSGGQIVEIKVSAYTPYLPVPDTSWSTNSDPMDVSVPTYIQANGSEYNWANGIACAAPKSLTYSTGPLILDAKADRILALITPKTTSGLPLIGVGLCYPTSPLAANGSYLGGYNFLFTIVNGVRSVVFLFDNDSFSTNYPYSWQEGQPYYMAMQFLRSEGKLQGKVWKVTEEEPTTWQYTWGGRGDRDGYAALIGSSIYGGGPSTACIDKYWLKATNAAPALINVAQSKPVTAPAQSNGSAWVASGITDADFGSVYSTDCVDENSVVSVVVDTLVLSSPQQMALKMRNESPGAFPIDFKIAGSLNGKDWTDLVSITNQPRLAAELILTMPSTNGVYGEYRYFRLLSTKNGSAGGGDCIRVQIAGWRILAPSSRELPNDDKMTILEVGRAYIGKGGNVPDRNILYFVKNGRNPSTSSNSNEVTPVRGFKNMTTGATNGLDEKGSLFGVDAYLNGNGDTSSFATIMRQAQQQGFVWWCLSDSISKPGETVRVRLYGISSEKKYLEFDFVTPADSTILNVKTIFPV